MEENVLTLFSADTENGSSTNLFNKLVNQLKCQEEFIVNDAMKAADIIHQFLGYHLGILDFGMKQGLDFPLVKTSQSVSPMKFDLSSLNHNELNELKTASLQTLIVLVKNVKKSRIFAYWYIFLPNCTFNQSKRGILELVTYPCMTVREKAFDLLVATFHSSSNHLQLANAHCKPGSFTPVCLEFAQALSRYVRFT